MSKIEKHMKLLDREKRILNDELRKSKTQRNSFYNKPGKGRENEKFEKAANRRSADIYVQNH